MSFTSHSVSPYEILKIVNSFPSNNAPGMDKVSTGVIKDALPIILPALTEIVNCSLLTAVFPLAWNLEEIESYINCKGGGITKYQMITVLFLCFLWLLRFVSRWHSIHQLMEYLSQKGCLTEHQSGNKVSLSGDA